MAAYRRLKIKENFKILVPKVAAVVYQIRSLIRSSKCSDLTGKLLVFWKTGRCGKVIATGGSAFRVFYFLLP